MVQMRCVLASSLAALVAAQGVEFPADVAPRRYTVSLDDDPAHRWDHVALAEKEVFSKNLAPILKFNQLSMLGPMVDEALDREGMYEKIFPGTIHEEIKGIARVTGLSTRDIATFGMYYDLLTAKESALSWRACSGIVAQTASGEIWHGRNMDFEFTDQLKAMTITVDFTSKNVTKFTTVALGPNPMINTGVKYGAFSVTQDQRQTGSGLTNLQQLLVEGRVAMMAAIRVALESDKVSSYEQAVQYFSQIQMAAPAYFILGGTKPGEGAVITRGRSTVADLWRLNPAANRWYVAVTNYDYDHAANTDNSNFGDHRLVVENKAMDAIGQANINGENVWSVLSIDKVNTTAGERAPYNSMTIYTTIMQASKPDSFKTMVRADAEASLKVV